MNLTPTEGMLALERLFTDAGHEIVFVGGCVRDAILGLEWKDVDLATSATPDEQVAIYRAAGIRYFETGLKHGTITALVESVPLEITTYRMDLETDGRHAVVEYTKDLAVDLRRRDLTINAIAMRFDGTLVDPFGGREDALAGIVRFVGDANARLHEDYLRILRWFRFTGRFLRDGETPDRDSVIAVGRNAEGLGRISVERVWSEFSRILVGPNAEQMVRLMGETGVAEIIGLPDGDFGVLTDMPRISGDPATALGAYLGNQDAAITLARRWKLSNEERADAVDVASRRARATYGMADGKLDLVNGIRPAIVDASLRLRGMTDDADTLRAWTVPAFPVDGLDLIGRGMKQGLELGTRMREMRAAWAASDYALTRDELLKGATA